MTDSFNDETVYSLVCMVCAQTKTRTGLQSRLTGTINARNLSEIDYRSGRELEKWWRKDCQGFEINVGFRKFVKRYGQEWKVSGRQNEDLAEFGPTPWEWRRTM